MNGIAQSSHARVPSPSNNLATGIDSSSILRALELIHSPHTDNDVRRNASTYLEQLKDSNDAAEYGFSLGTDRRHPPLVRHFGLSLLEHVVRQKWHELDEGQGSRIRVRIIDLGKSLEEKDPTFLRNKVAQLWIELAKRSWALDWFDMDSILVGIWDQNLVSKEFVLTILENLSEDVFIREDSAAVLRGRELSGALVEIFTSSAELSGGIKVGNSVIQVRFGSEGWLSRINQFLGYCQGESLHVNLLKACLAKALATVRSVFSWVMTTSIISSGCLPSICGCLNRQDPDILMAAIEALLALYGRPRLEDPDIESLVYPLCHPSNSAILEQLYGWSVVPVSEIESPNYAISKKLSEMVSLLADWIAQKPPSESESLDFSVFFKFLILIAQHESLIVSIPIVHSWTRLLAHPVWRKSDAVVSCIGPLVDFASQRTVQYDQLPDEAEEPSVMFVYEDIETFPERQGFFLNYRRMCGQIIELICFKHLAEAIPHVISQVDRNLDQLQESERGFNPATYERQSVSILQADAQFSNTESAFRGFCSWRSAYKDIMSGADQQLLEDTTLRIKNWSVEMLSRRSFKNPAIKQRLIKSAVEISNRALQNDTSFALNVLEHILTALIPNEQNESAYSESVDDLHMYAANELIRLSMHHADYFATFYGQLETKIQQLTERVDLDEKSRAGMNSCLFLIVQRTSEIDPDLRKNRLWGFLEPILHSWQHPSLLKHLSSFEEFAESQHFNQVGPYLMSINAAHLQDWPNASLDSQGNDIRKAMLSKRNVYPLRITRTMLAVSTDKLSLGSSAYDLVCELWSPVLPYILQGVLQLVEYNHRLHNPLAWPNMPTELEGEVKKLLQDRYWQSGISEGSVNDFHASIKSSKHSLEGFASSVRGRIRSNLENCYSILHTLGKLGDAFFSIPQMPDMVARSLCASSGSLSSHNFSVLLNMISRLIVECPPSHRSSFLPPVLSTFLVQLDRKCTMEWQNLSTKKVEKTQMDDLNAEMREDSILRTLTYRAVNMVASWVDRQRDLKPSLAKTGPNRVDANATENTMRAFILSRVEILEPLLMFCTHALTYPDTRSCANMVRVLRSLVADFAPTVDADSQTATVVREFVSTEVMKAAITSLNDGHFVDQQKDLANLIATIWIAYGLPTHIPATAPDHPALDRPPLTQTPRNILLSLPGIVEQKVDDTAAKLAAEGGLSGNHRHQRALILSLLEGLRGVRLSELGKIDTAQQKSKLMEKYIRRESMGMQGVDNGVQQPVDLEADGDDFGGVGELFA